MVYIQNPYQGVERQKKLYDFEEARSLNENLKKSFEKIGRNISDSISTSTSEIVGVLDDNFDVVTNTLNIGFSDVSSKLNNISFSIENLALMFDWRLSEMINQQRISNILLGNIVLLLRVPDFQKERQYYIEQGFKHYKNASLDEDLYEDALKNLLEAERREVTDYIVLYQIGMIYLHSTKDEIKDFAKAEDYFRRAAKYSIVESNSEAQRTLNILVGEKNESISTPEAAKAFAANSYFRAGISCYLQNKFLEAVELCEKAYSLSPPLLESGFLKAKSLVALDKSEEAAKVLQGVIQAQPFIYILRVAADSDLESKDEIKQLLKQMRDSAVHQASERLLRLKSKNCSNPQFESVLSEINSLIQKKSFLDALKAIKKLEENRKWEITNFSEFLYESFLQTNSLSKDADREIFFDTFQRYEQKYQRLLSKNPSVEDLFIILGKIGESLEEIVEEIKQKEDEMQTQSEYDIQLLIRLEQDRKQIKEFISQAQIEEGINLNLAIQYYEKAAKLGSWEAGQRLQTLKKQSQPQVFNKNPQGQIKELLLKAQMEEENQNKKWLFKNYDLAIYYYEEAAKLGSYEAQQKIKELKNK